MTEYSKRTCGRASNASWTCDPVYFPVSGGPYSQVCGRIRAYQWGLPDAFLGFKRGQTTINDAYFSGVAVMHGSPRQHIWTFACGPFENRPDHSSQLVHVALMVVYRSHNLLVKITSVRLDMNRLAPRMLQSTDSTPGTLYGMGETVTQTVHVVLSAILHISPKPSTSQLLMTLN